MFLAIGNSSNYEHAAFKLVKKELKSLGSGAILFRQDECLDGSYITFDFTDGQPVCKVSVEGTYLNVDSFEGVLYLKPRLPKSLREHPDHEYRIFIARQFRDLRRAIKMAFRGKRWLNDPQFMDQAENKPWQLSVAAQSGLKTPKTIITSDPEAAKDFVDKIHGDAVIKLLATSPLPDRVIYTTRINDDIKSQFDRLRLSPVILQECVEKSYELRVTIVGEDTFVARIDSQDQADTALDWRRTPIGNDFEVKISKWAEVPDQIVASLRRYMEILGLRYGAADFIVTPNGDHVFLELNPNGQWHFVQERTGYNIAKSIARLLLS